MNITIRCQYSKGIYVYICILQLSCITVISWASYNWYVMFLLGNIIAQTFWRKEAILFKVFNGKSVGKNKNKTFKRFVKSYVKQLNYSSSILWLNYRYSCRDRSHGACTAAGSAYRRPFSCAVLIIKSNNESTKTCVVTTWLLSLRRCDLKK